jgi:hypothetical protein
MSPTFPCPNPTCTQVFSTQDVRGVSSLTCPKCGTVFNFGTAPAPAPPRPAKPAASPRTPPKPAPAAKAPPPPVAKPVAPPAAKPVPLATPVSPKAPPPPKRKPVEDEAEEADDFDPPEPDSRRGGARGSAKGRRKDRGSGSPWLIVIGSILIVVFGVGAGAAWVFRDRLLGGTPTEEDTATLRAPALNYSFRAPPRPWVQDKELERDAGVQLAFRRSGPSAWFALAARDYKDRMPRDDEMLREAITRLKRFFKKAPEWELRDEESLADNPAQRFVFTAENTSNVAVVGECLMTAKGGVAYWLFSWTPAADEAVLADQQQEWADIRGGFAFLGEREGWKGKEPKLLTAEGTKEKYTLRYAEGLWSRDDEPAGADLLLLGRDPDNPQDARRWAFVRVFVLDHPDRDPKSPKDELQEARAFVEAREKELYAETKLERVPDAAKGGLPEGSLRLGKVSAEVARLRVKKDENYEHFFAVAAVPRKTSTLVIVCECAWNQRDAWEQRFGPVLHSLAFEK